MKKTLLTILEIILIIRILFSAYKIYEYYSDLHASEKQYNEVSKIVDDVKNENNDDEKEEDDEAKKKEEAARIIRELKKINSDIVGYIEVEGLPIEYPIVQAKDNNYYLRRNLNETYSIAGTVFMDYRNDPKMSDQNTVVYGHNMRNDSMFGSMSELRNQEFVNKNGDNLIRYITSEGVYLYKMFSYFVVEDTYDYRTPNLEDDLWIEFLNKTISMSEVDFNSGIEVSEDTKILTLSTCDSNTKYRNVIQAYFVGVE